MPLRKEQATTLLEAIKRSREQGNPIHAIVVGDIIVDDFIHGYYSKFTDEGPAPVFMEVHRNAMVGAAANVARNLMRAGCLVDLFGTLGDDRMGEYARKLLRTEWFSWSHTNRVFSTFGSTTVKARYMVNDRLVFRGDVGGARFNNGEKFQYVMPAEIKSAIAEHKVPSIVLSDYAHGVISGELVGELSGHAELWGDLKPIEPIVNTWPKFKVVLGPRDLQVPVSRNTTYQTWGHAGVRIITDRTISVPALTRSPLSVVGAGDCFFAWAHFGHRIGLDPFHAGLLGNVAAGLGVRKAGLVFATIDEVMDYLVETAKDR